jgi:uncharacterized protein YggL (DUF469 family)
MNTVTAPLHLYDILVEQGVEKERAKKAVDAFITRIEAEKELATKGDISDVKTTIEHLNTKLAETKADIIQWVAAMLVAQAAAIIALQNLING